MPVSTWNLEWQNSNSQRHYPLTSDSSGVDVTGSFILPQDFIVGLDFPIDSGHDVNPDEFYILNIGVYSSGFVVILGYNGVAVASASIPIGGFVKNTTYALGGMGDYADSIGKITIGNIVNINQQPAGFFTFNLVSARIEPDCIRPMIQGVSSILVTSGPNQTVRLYGDIELVANANMQISTVVVAGQNPQILFSAIQGEGLSQPCVCNGSQSAPPIRRINGVSPTAAGDMTLTGLGCVQITATSNGLQFLDTCSSPCCGCAELEAITTDLQQLGIQATTLQGFLSNLQNSVNSMANTVLGSQLGDQSCGSGCA